MKRSTQTWILVLIRVLAVPTALLTVLIAYDLFGPAARFDEARVTRRYVYRSRQGKDYNIEAQGRFHYNGTVGRNFYDRVRVGDTIKVELSRFFSEWKSLELVRDGKVLARTTGVDIYAMGLFGLLFLVALLVPMAL